MDSAPPVDTVAAAIHALYHNPDAAEKERASMWLQEFQRSVISRSIDLSDSYELMHDCN